MASNPYVNKVQKSDGTVIIDLTSDTVEADYLVEGYTAHGADGSLIQGALKASGREPDLGTKSITANGTYNASTDDLDGYSSVTVNVPNTYSINDEGKVVDNGELINQTSRSINSNGAYDTTTNSQVIVDVPCTHLDGDTVKY